LLDRYVFYIRDVEKAEALTMRSPYLLLPILLVLFSLSSCSQAQTISQLSRPNPSFEITEPIITRRPDSTSQGCPQEIPRHPEALKISEEGSQYERIAVYETELDPELLLDYYDAQLEPKGWSIHSRSYGNGVESARYGYSFPASTIDINISIPQVIQDTYHYTVALRLSFRSQGGFDAYCSHLYP
jgi:hypothetical protein